MPKDPGFIIIARQCFHTDTQPTHTVNRPHLYPDVEQRTLLDFAGYFNFVNVEDYDAFGRNIFVLPFEALKCCWFAAETALHCFHSSAPKMAGGYKKALSQRITTGPLAGRKPLHILCHDSDACLLQLEIIKMLVENNYVTITDFEELFLSDDSSKVIIFPPSHW